MVDLNMEDTTPPPQTESNGLPRVSYTSIDDFMKEQDELASKRLESGSRSPPTKKQRKSASGIGPAEIAAYEHSAAESIGDENWVGLLQRYCDAHPGRKPKYEEPLAPQGQRFQCFVTVQPFEERCGGHEPESEQRKITFATKKIAKQYAAKQAIDWLIANKHMPSDGTLKFPTPATTVGLPDDLILEQKAIESMGDDNWIGRLVEYYQVNPNHKPRYQELTLTEPGKQPRFQYVLNVDGYPERQFECLDPETLKPITFSNKKSARQYVSRHASQWLAAQQQVCPAATPAPTASPNAAVRTKVGSPKSSTPLLPPEVVSESPSYTALIPELCRDLDMPALVYNITPATNVPGCPLWHGYADFSGDPRYGEEGRLADVRNVHGKKRCKEEIAKIVYSFLQDIKSHRLKMYEEEDASESPE